ncbi:MAG: hypothetical protein GW875_12930 [Deltaproteobacteria bacterium]|nr:hypothetical protein [Deltaproteobacteria bacterium]NCP03180.1 hypothetical protein [Deltaproteobacteria bacterium]
MLKTLDLPALRQLLCAIAAEFELRVPVQPAPGMRLLAPWPVAEIALFGPPLQPKPTAAFFPQTQTLLTLGADASVELPSPPVRPLALFGLARADLQGIAFLDRFFSAPPADDVYQRLRRDALLIGLSGNCGTERKFLPLAGGHCDFELIAQGTGWWGRAHTPRGAHWLRELPAAEGADLTWLNEKSAQLIDEPQQLLARAAKLLVQERVPEEFWREIAARCILCCGCNQVCPTCNCFCVEDQLRGTNVERRRVWDSCQLDAFMREASGHNPLGTEALRTRRRIFHKLVADPQRWGEYGCVACGRCDAACPTGIGIFALCEQLVARYS